MISASNAEGEKRGNNNQYDSVLTALFTRTLH